MSLDRRRGHELLPKALREKLPALYSQGALGLNALAWVKFFTPDSNWTWYAAEGSPVDEDGYYDTDKPKVDFFMFGLVCGHEIELGYFALSELESAVGPRRMPIERDYHFQPDTLGNLKNKHAR